MKLSITRGAACTGAISPRAAVTSPFPPLTSHACRPLVARAARRTLWLVSAGESEGTRDEPHEYAKSRAD
uniref:Uncharacterized protein n=1 Tax=Knipowitschia caucasica TaxID=637954 RepID=A0AAV2JGX4_KNICA